MMNKHRVEIRLIEIHKEDELKETEIVELVEWGFKGVRSDKAAQYLYTWLKESADEYFPEKED